MINFFKKVYLKVISYINIYKYVKRIQMIIFLGQGNVVLINVNY